MVTRLMVENEENIKNAIGTGISSEAVESTLSDLMNKSDKLFRSPKQIKTTVEAIVDMKQNSMPKPGEYKSNFVRENNGKIESALNEGITPSEITNCLTKETNKQGKTNIKFMVKLISKMKQKELTLSHQKQQGYQKILIKY